MAIGCWTPKKEFFSHPYYPGVVVDCSSSRRIVRVVTYSLDTYESQIGQTIFLSLSLHDAFRFVENNFTPVVLDQIMLEVKPTQLGFRAIVGLALSCGVSVWAKSDRCIKAYFSSEDQRNSFIRLSLKKGAYAQPNEAQYYTVRGCSYSAIVRY